MQIKSFSYSDTINKWELAESNFNDLNLLVGISGVGKTQILNSLRVVSRIAAGETYNGISFSLVFQTSRKDEYRWEASFEMLEHIAEQSISLPDFVSQGAEKPKIEHEFLSLNGKTILERDAESIILSGAKTPKLDASQSALSLLKFEDLIAPASREMNKIVSSSMAYNEAPEMSMLNLSEFELAVSRLDSLKKIRESELSIGIKLSLIFSNCFDTFEEIRDEFIDVFPQVEDVVVNSNEQFINGRFVVCPTVLVKEKGVPGWVNQKRLSAGMHKTFYQITQSHLWPEGSVILIDEFENSLGINCINILTDIILGQSRRLQFIITSHHPYIINNIDQRFWRVVVRNKGMVRIKDAESLGLGKSNHEAFIQLINNQDYIDGISSQ
ncbi:putative ATPase [Sedimentisphaera cyanobacteriorum]|uniref:Putative ATPase n=1 Tax=Sedimentisphaera cyanobacteriorum TaxID=1940790 RepID=A0A1Q2HQK2_9BACT|nr:AAA family ATPase [Sedimentisphaera cyanobacteriorum]AQQ09729.1 putative ATPase [Sedimentisphaera cyanobacteriorum]